MFTKILKMSHRSRGRPLKTFWDSFLQQLELVAVAAMTRRRADKCLYVRPNLLCKTIARHCVFTWTPSWYQLHDLYSLELFLTSWHALFVPIPRTGWIRQSGVSQDVDPWLLQRAWLATRGWNSKCKEFGAMASAWSCGFWTPGSLQTRVQSSRLWHATSKMSWNFANRKVCGHQINSFAGFLACALQSKIVSKVCWLQLVLQVVSQPLS